MYLTVLSTLIAADRHPDPSRAAAVVYPGLFFLFTALACWLAVERLPLLLDNQHYFFIAERAASGVPPHVSQFDPKHTLSLLISAAAIWLGRGVGVADVTSARIVSIAVTAGSMALLWSVVRRLSGSVLAAHIGAVAMMSFHRFVLMGAMGARPKVFLVFFMIVVVHYVSRRRWFAVGMACALAFLCWQPALLLAAVAAMVVMAGERRWRGLAWLGAGLLLPNLLYEGYFWTHSALAEQIEQSYVFPAGFMLALPRHFAALARRASWIFELQSGPSLESLVPLLSAVAALLALVAVIRQPLRLRRIACSNPGLVYVTVSGLAGLAFLLTNYQGFPDRFFIEPYMAIAAGLLLGKLPGIFSNRWRPACTGVLSIGAAGCVVALLFGGVYKFGQGPERDGQSGLEAQYDTAENLARDFLDAGSSVYAVGCTHMLAFSHVNNFSRFGFFFRGVGRYLASQQRSEREFLFGDRGLPDVVLVSRGRKRMRSQSWLSDFYELADSRRYGNRKDLWIRKSPASGSATADNLESAAGR